MSIMLLNYSNGTVLFIFVPQITSSILCFLYFIVFVQNSFGFISIISVLSDVYRKCPYKFSLMLNDFEKSVKRRNKNCSSP